MLQNDKLWGRGGGVGTEYPGGWRGVGGGGVEVAFALSNHAFKSFQIDP